MADTILSCESSLQAGEPLYATAPVAQTWLLLEYNAAWGKEALPESTLSASIKTFIQNALASVPDARFGFIRHDREPLNGERRCFVAVSREADSRLYSFNLSSVDGVFTLDLPALVRGDTRYDSALTNEPLYIVCTNGKRDAACARFGLPLYNALRDLRPEQVWQTIHIGGHRFAGTLVALPQGLYYGRVAPEDAPALIDAHERGDLLLNKLRGRSIYPAPVQAAEQALRDQLGLSAIAAVRRLRSEATGEHRWQVTLEANGQAHTLMVEARKSEFNVQTDTGGEAKPVMLHQVV
ncbi:MAG: hypothetical protein J0M33_04640 [Anaerolineae bacterium]|nr:hypothetical protein [Anaerolineae bacterium]